MPLKKSAATLKNISLMHIARNMNFWCQDYMENFAGSKVLYVIGPFDCLPHALVLDLLSLLKEKKWLKRIHLQLLLHAHMERLDLSVGLHGNLDSHLYDHLTELISSRCQKLKYLNLSFCNKIRSKALVQLPPALPSIETLHLCATATSDAVLSALGGHCHDLRELDVSDCAEVTDAGISALCVDLQNENGPSGCLKLCRLNVEQTSVTVNGSLCALINLPFLKVFRCRGACAALLQHFGNLKNGVSQTITKFQLENLTLKFWRISPEQCPEVLQMLTETCPNITELSLYFQEPVQHILMLTCFKNLQELTILGAEDLSFDGDIATLLQLVGKQLKALTLFYILKIDIGVVGQSCPSLRNLCIYNPLGCTKYISTNRESSGAEPFKHLEKLDVDCLDSDCGISCSQLTHVLLHSHKLRSIKLQYCDELTDHIIKMVLKENSLACLESLSLHLCNNITAESINDLISLNNPLHTVNLVSCRLITLADFELMKKKTKDQNLQLDIAWT